MRKLIIMIFVSISVVLMAQTQDTISKAIVDTTVSKTVSKIDTTSKTQETKNKKTVVITPSKTVVVETQESTKKTSVKTSVETPVVKPRSDFGIALGVSASTNGLGVNLVAALNKFIALRLSYEKLDNSLINNFYTIPAIPLDLGGQSLALTPTIKTGGISGIIDLYLAKSFYLCGGVVYTDFDLSVDAKLKDALKLNDVTLQPDKLGGLHITIEPERKLSPYVGFGIGRNISRNHRLCMNLEFGAYSMKSYVFGLSGTNMFEATAAGNNAFIEKLNETMKTISWSGIYPVIKIGISYKIFGESK